MTTVIITICALLLIAYLFDLTSSKSKIPSVILLLLLGWLVIVSAGPTVDQKELPPPSDKPAEQPSGVPEH
jgi:Kef-type K+ transport system membrane component KefB